MKSCFALLAALALVVGCEVARSGQEPAVAEVAEASRSARESTPSAAPTPAPVQVEPSPLVDAARAYLGRPYSFGGRGEQLDCLGLIFRAWADVTGQSWRSLSVMPTTLVGREQLGAPVPGLAGVRTADIDWSVLRPGDFVLLLDPMENPAEPALVEVDGEPMWVWHTGLYAGGPKRTFIVGDHYAGQVVETPLPEYLREHAIAYSGLFVVRPGD